MTEFNDPYAPRPYTFDRTVRIIFTVCAVVAAIFLLDVLKGVLLPFLVACLIAYLLEPVVKFNMKVFHVKSRFLPVMLTLIEACAFVGLLCALFVPYIVSETASMAELLKRYAASQINIPFISDSIHRFIRENIDFNRIVRYLSTEEWKELIQSAFTSSWNIVSSSLSMLFGMLSWAIVVLYVIFIMIDYERLMLSFRQLVPYRHRHRVFHIFDDIKNAMNRYFRGQFIVAMCVGVLFSIGFLIIGLPMAVVLGLFIGMLNMVPYLQVISLPIAVLLCLVATVSGDVSFWMIFWECMAVYVIVQCIQDLILTPKIMGKVMGLNPAIILLSLSVWGCLLGFMGLIIALPLTTLILSYYDLYVIQRVKRKKLMHALHRQKMERGEENPAVRKD